MVPNKIQYGRRRNQHFPVTSLSAKYWALNLSSQRNCKAETIQLVKLTRGCASLNTATAICPSQGSSGEQHGRWKRHGWALGSRRMPRRVQSTACPAFCSHHPAEDAEAAVRRAGRLRLPAMLSKHLPWSGESDRAASGPRHFSWAINPGKGFALFSRVEVKHQQMCVLFSGLARADGCTLRRSTRHFVKVQVTTAVSYNNQK